MTRPAGGLDVLQALVAVIHQHPTTRPTTRPAARHDALPAPTGNITEQTTQHAGARHA